MIDYEQVKKWTRIVVFIASALMILLGIGKFFDAIFVISRPIDGIINIYLM